jgi:enoyl-CoA hydratase
MSEELVLVEKSGGVATVTLNRPDKLNALNSALRRRIAERFRELGGDTEVAVIVLTGAGKAFCAGVDLKELGGEVASDASLASAVTSGEFTEALDRVPQPIIAAVNGAAITGGFELVLACDILYASTEARFADTHARVGIMPGWGLSQRLSRCIGPYRAKELSLSGNFLSAEQAEHWGLVNRVLAPAELLPAAQKLASEIASCDPVVVRKLKRVIDDGYARDFATGLAIEQERAREHVQTLDPKVVAERRAAIQARGRTQA